tara:strand:+ start:329 stop:445 length:117 start_codon:yes stop_codon:yes gene_type:complete
MESNEFKIGKQAFRVIKYRLWAVAPEGYLVAMPLQKYI